MYNTITKACFIVFSKTIERVLWDMNRNLGRSLTHRVRETINTNHSILQTDKVMNELVEGYRSSQKALMYSWAWGRPHSCSRLYTCSSKTWEGSRLNNWLRLKPCMCKTQSPVGYLITEGMTQCIHIEVDPWPWCREVNLGPLLGKSTLLAAEPSPQSQPPTLFKIHKTAQNFI